MDKQSPISLLSFFCYNSDFGPKEGEEEKKILFYYPPSTDIDRQIKDVGLCEAVTMFTGTFSDKDTESLHTQKTRQLFFQPEPGFWCIMTIAIPKNVKMRDDQQIEEYNEEDVQDSVYLAVLRQAYQMFKLFNGSMQHIIEESSVDGLKQTLKRFFTKYLQTMKLQHCDILDIFNGIHFLPLDKNTYLRIQSFINQLEAMFPVIENTAFLYNDQLVWSGLEQGDMRTLYRYLITSLFPSQLEQAFQSSGVPSVPSSSQHYGRYILGPPNINREGDMGKIPHVFVEVEHAIRECYLVVYRSLSATICLLLSGEQKLEFELLKRLDKFLGPYMGRLASDIGDQYSASRRQSSGSAGEPQYKYVYFNHMNLAQKTTVHSDSKKSANVNIPPEILRVLGDLNHDLKTSTNVDEGETVLKTASECWVVGKKSDQREFYVVLNNKLANLTEINEEVKRLCAVQFNNIFFLD